ncbi:MAG: DUF2510 domain-containing protein, partial [Actinomycetes bacterium]
PDPGGGVGLYRYWDGRAWSAATSPNPAAPPPAPALGAAPPPSPAPGAGSPISGPAYGQGAPGTAYAAYQSSQKSRSGIGWWVGAAALMAVIALVAVIALRAIGGNDGVLSPTIPGRQPTQDPCPQQTFESEEPAPARPADGRVHGGPLSFPVLRSPWQAPTSENRVPFGRDVRTQMVTVEPNYNGLNNWVASVLVGELQAGDGFFTPQQGSQIVVRCILGAFYGDNPVRSDVQVNEATTIDGHEAWLVESELSFDIEGLRTKGELLIVAIVATGATAGLYYASIPDTRPELVQPARDTLAALQVDA